MKSQSQTTPDLTAWKHQQEANRAAYLKRRYTAAELWQQQQAALTALERLRPVGARRRRARARDTAG